MTEKNNPFPNRTFLIEIDVISNTSNFLNEYRETYPKKVE